MSNRKLSKREKRRQRNNQNSEGQNQQQRGLHLGNIKPLTKNQERVFHSYNDDYNLVLHGFAGTGKTLLAMYLGLKDVLDRDYEEFDKVVIVRSTVQTRNMGFMPGGLDEKASHYELPYKAICTELFGRGDAYEILKQRDQLEFVTTTFIRGITLNNAIVLVDESQNMDFHELDSIMTRLGRDSKIIFCGDFRQADLRTKHDKSGLPDFLQILDKVGGFEKIEFVEDDIVRSQSVKDYLIKKMELGM